MEFTETMIKMMKFNYGQTTLEIGMAIALAIILVVATISVWNYVNKTMIERHQEYNASRLAAVKDIRGYTFGMQPSYVPPNLSIFSLSGSIDNAPPFVPPGEGNSSYVNCYDNLSIAMANVNLMRFQALNLTQQIVNITQQALQLKADLGMNVGAAEHLRLPSGVWIIQRIYRFPEWLYGFGVGWQIFFDKSFQEIRTSFDVKVASYTSPHRYVDFFKPWDLGYYAAQHHYTASELRSNYLNVGKAMEDSASAMNQQRSQLEQSANNLETQSWQDFYVCTGSSSQGNQCYQQCRHFQDTANNLMQQAMQALAAGNMALYQQLSNLAQQAQGNFTVCYDNCAN